MSVKERTSHLHAFYTEVMDICVSAGLVNATAIGNLSIPNSSSSSIPQGEGDVLLKQRDEEEKNPPPPIVGVEETPCEALVKPVIASIVAAKERFYLKKMGRGNRFVPGIDKNPLVRENDVQSRENTPSSTAVASFISLTSEPVPNLPSAHKNFRYHCIKPIKPNENKKAGKKLKAKKGK